MSKVIRKVHINAPKDQVWAILADFGGVQTYNPNVPNSYSTSSENGGVGATRHCDLGSDGASIEERIVEWYDGKSYVIDIYDGNKMPPFKSCKAYLAVEDDGPGTMVTGTLDFHLKYGLIGALMDKAMVKPQFGSVWSKVLAGLKQHAETGESVDGSTQLNLGSVFSTQ